MMELRHWRMVSKLAMGFELDHLRSTTSNQMRPAFSKFNV